MRRSYPTRRRRGASGGDASEAERWFQALRAWRTRTQALPRSRPWASKGTWLPRHSGRCPVCHAPNVEELDARLASATTAREFAQAVRRVAQELGTSPRRVHAHWLHHVYHGDVGRLVGAWVHGAVEYVDTPLGWLPSSRVLGAIRAHPEAALLLAIVQGRTRRRTLLHHGHYRDERARRIGRALLELAGGLD